MSRLIIKNLPPYLTPDGLRKHFSQNGAPSGTITDIKISHKPDGTSRRFGFVGFKTDKEAAAARDWFDKTFVDATRISVTVVEGVSYSHSLWCIVDISEGRERCSSTSSKQTAANGPRSACSFEDASPRSRRKEKATSLNNAVGCVPRGVTSPKRTLMGKRS